MKAPSNNARTEPAPTAPSRQGRVINFRYEILEDHRVGSRFYTYKARDRVLNRLACVKILRSDVVADPMAVEVIMTEAQTTINLAHPGIARVYECGKDADDFFVVTEWVRGVSLADRLERVERFGPREAVDIAIAIAEAIEHGHKNGFVHGDLRAENVMISQEGDVKVADFAIGPPSIRAMDPANPDVLRIARSLSPEAVRGKDLTTASDLYQLGALMFRMVCGRHAFDGASAQEVALMRLNGAPPGVLPSTDIPRALEGLILKCMQPDPQDRYRTATELLEDLRTVRNGLRLGRDLNWSPLDSDEEREEGRGVAGGRAAESRLGGSTTVLKTFASAAGVVLGVAVLALIFAAWLRLTNPGEVEVPSVIGMSVEDAGAALAEVGLTAGSQSLESSGEYAAGAVIRQNPEPGLNVKRGRMIDLTVSSGPEQVVVPKVVDAPEDRARKQIRAAGLEVGKVTNEPSAVVPEGRVIAQIPDAGSELMQGGKVDLVLSAGPEPGEGGQGGYVPGGGDKEESHWVHVRLTLKPEPPTQRIRLVVTDALGTSVVYDEVHDAGETVRRTVEVRGQYRLRVFGGERGETLLREYTPYPEG
jgi:tRNA A-37 threonylcarbamoyl transferase component Bud32